MSALSYCNPFGLEVWVKPGGLYIVRAEVDGIELEKETRSRSKADKMTLADLF
jgi:hypothetical protein